MAKTSTSFTKGRSGNPKGKPRGAKHRATVAAQTLLDGEAEALTRKAIELANGGDMTALRLCLERILPPRKDRPITFKLPAVETVTDIGTAAAAVLKAVAGGEITPSEGQAVSTILEGRRKALELIEIEQRLSALEQKQGVAR